MRVCAKQTLANSLFNERERFLGLSRFGFSNFGTKLYGRQLILLSFNTGLGLFQRSARMLQLTFGGDDEFTLCPLGGLRSHFNVARSNPSLPRMPLMFEPGSRWAYGGSLDRVGRMVEIAGGQSLDRYFSDHITGPLGMNDTGFSLTVKQRARQASLHVRDANGKLLSRPLEKPNVPKVFSGGGGIYSTAPDYLTLLQALLNGGSLRETGILRPETVALMSANQIGNLEVGILKTTNPALSNDVDFFPGVQLRWGLGHMINIDPVPDGRKAGSLTWAGLFNTYYWIDPTMRIAGVIMMQILPFADRQALKAYRQFERGICHTPRPA
jgi:methyl acetate hydrolase